MKPIIKWQTHTTEATAKVLGVELSVKSNGKGKFESTVYCSGIRPEKDHTFDTLDEGKAWCEQTLQRWINASFEPIKQEILKEALKPTVYRLDYFDGEYGWYLIHSYDRAELEKLIADATEYHKTIKDLDFDDDEAVDAWLENHPLNDFNINDLLDIDDYEPLSGYLSINSFEVSGVSE